MERDTQKGPGRLLALVSKPAVHYVLLGAALYVATLLTAGATESSTPMPDDERPVVRVPDSRLVQARNDFVARNQREPTTEESAALRRTAVDRELLFRYALDLGLDDQPTARRRLVQIASFVDDGAAAERTEDELVEQALALGLHRDDVVLRRILIDSAERLIRGAVLAREPSEEALREHLAAHPERFVREERLGLDLRSGDSEDAEATDSRRLPLLLERDLSRRLGRDFLAALDREAVGEWQGPFESWQGPLRVRVRERLAAGPAPLDEVRDQVRAEVRQVLAERWLDRRLEQLRDEYDSRLGEPVLLADVENERNET